MHRAGMHAAAAVRIDGRRMPSAAAHGKLDPQILTTPTGSALASSWHGGVETNLLIWWVGVHRCDPRRTYGLEGSLSCSCRAVSVEGEFVGLGSRPAGVRVVYGAVLHVPCRWEEEESMPVRPRVPWRHVPLFPIAQVAPPF